MQVFAQNSNYVYHIDGPYLNYSGPYYIKVSIDYLQKTNNLWTTNWNVAEEATGALSTLNAVFNQHNIYFVPYSNSCETANYEVFTTNLDIDPFRATQDPAILANALHIYVTSDANPPDGVEFAVPNNYCRVSGQRNGVLGIRTEVLIHEVAHNLGLLHTHHTVCPEIPGACGANSPCTCCGDLICDIPFNPETNLILDQNCVHATLPESITKNFMSYVFNDNVAFCRSQFSPEQVNRMKTYLEQAPILQSLQIGTVKFPTTTPPAVSGNIEIAPGSELVINTPLEMLPGATIRIKKAGKLTVNSTITGACGQMWQGIIVEGNHFASQLPVNQGYVVINCFSELISLSTSGFNVTDNNFTLGRPGPCPATNAEIIGAKLMGNTTGFNFTRNNFAFNGTATPMETLIGVECQDLMEGMNNRILKNDYLNLNIGNRAKGVNSGMNDGLRYLCNTNDNLIGQVTDFKIVSGSINNKQAEQGDQGLLPAGNTFSTTGMSINNTGNVFFYYYYDNDFLQDPAETASGFTELTVNEEPVSLSNVTCSDQEPCNPCDELVSDQWKSDFFEKRSAWQNETAELPNITDSLLLVQKKEEIRNLRLEMNYYGEKVLRNYDQDTVAIQVDFIIQWLQLVQTYPTELRLARHYFFKDDFATFQQLWQQIEQNYDFTDAAADEFGRLENIYSTLKTYREDGGDFNSIPEQTINYLKSNVQTCDEAGYLSLSLLWRNGIRVPVDCQEPEARSNAHRVTDKIFAKTPFHVFPNPANETLSITFEKEIIEGHLRLCDTYGRIAKETTFTGNTNNIAIGHIAPGVYYLELYSGNTFVQRTKVIISH